MNTSKDVQFPPIHCETQTITGMGWIANSWVAQIDPEHRICIQHVKIIEVSF